MKNNLHSLTKTNPPQTGRPYLRAEPAIEGRWKGVLGLGLSLKAYACMLQAGGSCLVVLAPKEVFESTNQLIKLYGKLSLLYPHYPLLFLSETEGGKRYFGHPKAEQEIFELTRQVKQLQLEPPTYCLLPQGA